MGENSFFLYFKIKSQHGTFCTKRRDLNTLYTWFVWVKKFGYTEHHFHFCSISKDYFSFISSSQPYFSKKRSNFWYSWALFSHSNWPNTAYVKQIFSLHRNLPATHQQHGVTEQVEAIGFFLTSGSRSYQLPPRPMKVEEDWVWKMIMDSWGN